MVRTLVISVDRDNDLGVKAGVRGPVIGRKATLTAALRLGIADPEESDTNAIMGALHHHDRLVEKSDTGDGVEVAILTGDVRVGPRSDRAIASQLDEVIRLFQPDTAVLVTDGAEDEASLPIISSRVRIDHIEKIIVRQSKGIESTYYYIAKAIEDPRWRARLLVPIATFLLILGLGLILPRYGNILIGSLPLIIGGWILAKGLGWEQQLERLFDDMRSSASGGLFSSLLWAVSVVSVLFSILAAFDIFTDKVAYGDRSNLWIWARAIDEALQWLVIAGVCFSLSLGVLRWKEGTFRGQSILMIGVGLVAYTFINATVDLLQEWPNYQPSVSTVVDDWGLPFMSVVFYYLLRVVVDSLRNEDEDPNANRHWGI
ncbi:MAG: hypothetical protein CMB42_02430 [Euryarchaeota archaeon]|nr:hypothetical protein [Euryarchaeota archaeon]|tara:strand:- start:37891 stop:39009 length:1119 start_codon:yes stop_codon:yes gene_type:complete